MTPVIKELKEIQPMFCHANILISFGGLASDLYYENRGYIDKKSIFYNGVEWINNLIINNENSGSYSGDLEIIHKMIDFLRNGFKTLSIRNNLDYLSYHSKMLNLSWNIISNESVWREVIKISKLLEKRNRLEKEEILSELEKTNLFIERDRINQNIKAQITNIISEYNSR